MKLNINPTEEKLIGRWIHKNGHILADEVSQRIEKLIRSHLHKVASSLDGWSELYLDNHDGRYWELSYPKSENHGGGAPCLISIPLNLVREKYHLE